MNKEVWVNLYDSHDCDYEINNLGNVRVKEIWKPMYENEQNEDEYLYEDDFDFEISNFGNVRVKEIWKNIVIKDKITNYEVSIYGNIRNIKTQYIFKLYKKEYIRCYINEKLYLVHRIMGQAFLENNHNHPVVNHIDGNKHNNNLYNLEWSTASNNTLHAYANNLIKKTYKPIFQYDLNGNYITKFESMTSVCKTYNISMETLRKNAQGKIAHINNMIFKYANPIITIPHNSYDLRDFNELYLNKNYLIHKDGRIYSKKSKIFLKPTLTAHGYYNISTVINKQLHILIATQFIENPNNKPFVNHKDGNKTNNSIENLEWATCKENNIHAYEMNLNKRQIAVKQYTLDGVYIKTFRSISSACLELKYSISIVNVINNCCKGYYKHAKNYIWKYEHDDITPIQTIDNPHGKKAVYRYTLNGMFDKEYNCINDALIELGVKEGQTNNITKCCKGIAKTAYGYRWTYKKNVINKNNLNDCISNNNQISIHQCDLNGNILKTHDSITKAALSVGLLSIDLIKKCCNGERKNAYGYIWKYVNKIQKPIKNNDIKIHQYSLEGKFIQEHNTYEDAAKSIGSTHAFHIRNCCEGIHRKKYGGFYWKFSNEQLKINQNPMNTPVKQYNLDGKYIKTFKTNKEAALAVGAKNTKTIILCRKGQCKMAYNYKWV